MSLFNIVGAALSKPTTPTVAAEGSGPSEPPSWVTTNDGCLIRVEKYGSKGPAVLLIHGWSGSRHYWDLNARPISARGCMVYTYDQRFHGDSGRPAWGFHVARLAADLRDVLQQLDLSEVTVVGSSMGAAVIWSYLELFGPDRLAQAVFVDQAPLQNLTPDWKCGSTGCYDIASLTRLQCKLQTDFAGFARDNAAFCLTKPVSAEVLRVLQDETLRADPNALAALMADHTALDWRPILPRITIPCLNVVGRQSAVFPWYGCEAVGHMVPNCHTVFFEECNHWCYIEQPGEFNRLISDFATSGFLAVGKVQRL